MTTPAPTARPRRSARVQFTSTMLILEVFLVLFATLVAHGLAVASPDGYAPRTVWIVGGALMVVLAGLSRAVGRPGGYVAGSVAQGLVVAAGVVVPMMFVVGGLFVILWVVALRLGKRIDRERAQWDAAHQGDANPGDARG